MAPATSPKQAAVGAKEDLLASRRLLQVIRDLLGEGAPEPEAAPPPIGLDAWGDRVAPENLSAGDASLAS